MSGTISNAQQHNREQSAASLARQARQLIRAKRYREAFTLAAQARDQSPRCSQVNVIVLICSLILFDPTPSRAPCTFYSMRGRVYFVTSLVANLNQKASFGRSQAINQKTERISTSAGTSRFLE